MGIFSYNYVNRDPRKKWRYPGVPIPRRLRSKYKL